MKWYISCKQTALGTLTSGHIQLISKLILLMQKKRRDESISCDCNSVVGWLVGWMDGWMTERLDCCFVGWLVSWLPGWVGRWNCPPVSSCIHSNKRVKKQRKWKLWRMWNSTLKISKEWNQWTKLQKKDTHLHIRRMVKKYNDWTMDEMDKIIWKPIVIFACSNKQRIFWNEHSSAEDTLQKSSAAHDIKSPDSTLIGISTAPTLKFYG